MKKRVIPSILLGQGTSCQISTGFTPWRTVGTLAQQLKLHISRQADELLILSPSVRITKNSRALALISREVDIPISYAGSISSISDAMECISGGFEKIFLTSLFYDSPSSVRSIVDVLGSQSVGISLVYKYYQVGDSQEPYLWDYRTKTFTSVHLNEAVNLATSVGVGEILFYNADLDGTLSGLDIELLHRLRDLDVNVPLLIAGGAGTDEHFHQALSNYKVSGVVAASVFSLTESTPTTVREYCSERHIEMRKI